MCLRIKRYSKDSKSMQTSSYSDNIACASFLVSTFPASIFFIASMYGRLSVIGPVGNRNTSQHSFPTHLRVLKATRTTSPIPQYVDSGGSSTVCNAERALNVLRTGTWFTPVHVFSSSCSWSTTRRSSLAWNTLSTTIEFLSTGPTFSLLAPLPIC